MFRVIGNALLRFILLIIIKIKIIIIIIIHLSLYFVINILQYSHNSETFSCVPRNRI
jgi:hypothetical protein